MSQNPNPATVERMQQEDQEAYHREKSKQIRRRFERGEISQVAAQAELLKCSMFPSVSTMGDR